MALVEIYVPGGYGLLDGDLRYALLKSLRDQGFRFDGSRLQPINGTSKAAIRALHQPAVSHRRNRARKYLVRHENHLLRYIASGRDVDPQRIRPHLVEVHRSTEKELLFRWCCLHWSIPVSSGYGRRLRFLVFDRHNGKLIGLIGLGDPVFGLRSRDLWIGWDYQTRAHRLRHVMDAFVLGAVPPYSFLLGGKLVAMLAASNEVRNAVKRKYKGTYSRIRNQRFDGNLILITTSSALGRSSVYNRLRYKDRLMYKPVGFTRGSGEFHFNNGLYQAMIDLVSEHSEPTAKDNRWGNGFRNRREVVKKCLSLLKLPPDLIYHGVRRQVFVIPMAENAREFLRDQSSQPIWYDRSVADLTNFFKTRWLHQRVKWDLRYLEFQASQYRLWGDE